MKKVLFVLFAAAFATVQCKQESTADATKNYPESIVVTSSAYDVFYKSVVAFNGTLNPSQQKILSDYVTAQKEQLQKLKANISGRTSQADNPPVCNCLPGQTSCSADATFSSCCICCANGVSAVCGTTLGISSCRCDDQKNTREEKGEPTILVFTQEFKKLIDFANANNIPASPLKVSLDNLIAAAN